MLYVWENDIIYGCESFKTLKSLNHVIFKHVEVEMTTCVDN